MDGDALRELNRMRNEMQDIARGVGLARQEDRALAALQGCQRWAATLEALATKGVGVLNEGGGS